jgi:hypothetical protein
LQKSGAEFQGKKRLPHSFLGAFASVLILPENSAPSGHRGESIAITALAAGGH